MNSLFEVQVAVRDFMELGGTVLYAIAFTNLVMWVLIFERFLYFRTEHLRVVASAKQVWRARPEHQSWYAHRVREALISRVKLSSVGSIPLIKSLVVLCPLLGLLGTVTGMIEVFDVLSLVGTGTARSMAAGVSRATIPTMAGMVGALSGLLAVSVLARLADREVERLGESLTMDEGV